MARGKNMCKEACVTSNNPLLDMPVCVCPCCVLYDSIPRVEVVCSHNYVM